MEVPNHHDQQSNNPQGPFFFGSKSGPRCIFQGSHQDLFVRPFGAPNKLNSYSSAKVSNLGGFSKVASYHGFSRHFLQVSNRRNGMLQYEVYLRYKKLEAYGGHMKAVWGSKRWRGTKLNWQHGSKSNKYKLVYHGLPHLPTLSKVGYFDFKHPQPKTRVAKTSVGTTNSLLNLSQSLKSLAATKPLLSDRISCEEEGRRWQACFESKVRQERGGRQKPHEHRTTCGHENQCQLIPADFVDLSMHGPNVDPTRKVVISSKMRCCWYVYLYMDLFAQVMTTHLSHRLCHCWNRIGFIGKVSKLPCSIFGYAPFTLRFTVSNHPIHPLSWNHVSVTDFQ